MSAKEKLLKLLAESKDSYLLKSDQSKFKVSQFLRNYMNKNGLNQKRLSEKLHVSQAYISRVMHNEENLTLESLCKFARGTETEFEFNFVEPKQGYTTDTSENAKAVLNKEDDKNKIIYESTSVYYEEVTGVLKPNQRIYN